MTARSIGSFGWRLAEGSPACVKAPVARLDAAGPCAGWLSPVASCSGYEWDGSKLRLWRGSCIAPAVTASTPPPRLVVVANVCVVERYSGGGYHAPREGVPQWRGSAHGRRQRSPEEHDGEGTQQTAVTASSVPMTRRLRPVA